MKFKIKNKMSISYITKQVVVCLSFARASYPHNDSCMHKNINININNATSQEDEEKKRQTQTQCK